MDASEFRRSMEEFARSRNIPLNDVLHDIDETGMLALQRSDEERPVFFQRAFKIYCEGFPVPLPVGTQSLRRRNQEDSDD
jgi:hypothetical protein